jgi:hypothetical protein
VTNVIDLRTEEERMGALDFDLTPADMADAKVFQAQLIRQRDDRSAIERGETQDRERWS